MGQLVETIYAHGGDIIKFAGDAIICIFPAILTTKIVRTSGGRNFRRSIAALNYVQEDSNSDLPLEFENIDQAVSSAVQNMLSGNGSFEVDMDNSEKVVIRPELVLRAMHCADELRKIEMDQLTVHVAMTCGEMCFGILGGYEHRWECLISGPCLQELSTCLDDAPSKQAVISADCFEILRVGLLLPSGQSGTPGSSGLPKSTDCHFAGYNYSLDSLASGNYSIFKVSLSSEDFPSFPQKSKDKSSVDEVVVQSEDSRLSSYIMQFVPVHIAEGLSAGSGLKYIAEIREVTTMFMKVSTMH
jgi:hypothetical protein